MAGFLYALFQEKNLRDCARNGNYFGGKAVAVTGATDWLVSHKKIML